MPIHLNLLAEAQAAEELRRRDPVKRFLLASATVIGLILLWCLAVQGQILRANAELNRSQGRWKAMEKKHAEVTGNLTKSGEIERKLVALDRLSTNRFLLGSALDALQQTVVDKVQAVRVKTEQVFTYIEPVPPKTNDTKVIAGKPAASVEKLAITIEAKDWRPVDQNYNKFKEALALSSKFKVQGSKSETLNLKPETLNTPPLNSPFPVPRLVSLSKPSYDPSDPVAAYVMFTLEMQFPEIRRNE